jgi:archaeosine-15-forming tRNA-guanine transglycosylase
VDWDRDGNFSGVYDDVTTYTMKAGWFLGMREAYEVVAQQSSLALTLRNVDKRFSPEYTASPLAGKLLPNVPIRVLVDDGVVERVMWVGRMAGALFFLPAKKEHLV